MRISDEGLKHFLKLGHSKPSSVSEVYLLYSWKGVNYIGGLKGAQIPPEHTSGVFISLTESQVQLLKKSLSPQPEPKQQNNYLSPLTELFETALHLKLDSKKKIYAVSCAGLGSDLSSFSCDSNFPSPLQVISKTLKPFHGFYHPVLDFNRVLAKQRISTESLWISAMPIAKENTLFEILVGLSHNQSYGLDVFKKFNLVAQGLPNDHF